MPAAILVCKKFYLDVIQKELGISYNGNIIGIKVYIPVCQEASDIYKFHKDTLIHVFGIKLLDENQKIPLLYWTSKQHKDPYKFRFIAGASHCYSKQIYANLSLDVINGSLKSLIIKMFANRKSIAILVNSYTKKGILV